MGVQGVEMLRQICAVDPAEYEAQAAHNDAAGVRCVAAFVADLADRSGPALLLAVSTPGVAVTHSLRHLQHCMATFVAGLVKMFGPVFLAVLYTPVVDAMHSL